MEKQAEISKVQAKLELQIFVFKWAGWILVILGVLAGAWGCWQFHYVSKSGFSLTDLSNIGSYFQGAVGSLWALAGLMFIYVAFLGQRLQLVKQDEELETQQAQFAMQHHSILLQQFENGFFQLLNLQQKIIAGMKDKSNPITEGRECFDKWYKQFSEDYINEQEKLKAEATWFETKEEFNELNFLTKEYERFYETKKNHLGHYFRTLYHLFKFVNSCEALKDKDDTCKEKDSNQTVKNKKRYTSIVRAQLSQPEIALLFYNGLSIYGKSKFKPLIEKYGLLENLETSLLRDESYIMKCYEDGAYGK